MEPTPTPDPTATPVPSPLEVVLSAADGARFDALGAQLDGLTFALVLVGSLVVLLLAAGLIVWGFRRG